MEIKDLTTQILQLQEASKNKDQQTQPLQNESKNKDQQIQQLQEASKNKDQQIQQLKEASEYKNRKILYMQIGVFGCGLMIFTLGCALKMNGNKSKECKKCKFNLIKLH